MFVKKLVEKASKKQIGGGINSLHAEEVSPRLTFHYGVPSEPCSLAYDPIQNILAIATRNGQIKLLGRDNTQALLQSEAGVATKFLQFMDNQGVLLNVTTQNQIEVWDIDSKRLCYLHTFDHEITSFSVLQQSLYMYVGECFGNVSFLKLDHTQKHLSEMPYRIPFSKSYGEAACETPVVYTFPQPLAETKRVLIIFRDGLLVLWDIHSSAVVFTTGRGTHNLSPSEPKTVISACWACPNGSRVAIGYSNGDILLWAIPASIAGKGDPNNNTQNTPILKLNLGFKLDKVPIVSLKWIAAADGKTNRLYINGFSDDESSYSFQVLILNETTESRTIKLVLPLTEICLGMEHMILPTDKNKHRQYVLALLSKSGRICLYHDSEIEWYLAHAQSKSAPTLPSPLILGLPFNSAVTSAKLYAIANNGSKSNTLVEDYTGLANKYPHFIPINMKERDKSQLTSNSITDLSKFQNLYITGHIDGTINFWDASCPLLLLILSIKQQSEDGNGSSGTTPITSLHFDACSKVLISGDQNGLVRIITFKKDASENIFSFLQGKPGENYTAGTVKLKGAILSICLNSDFKHLAVGTDKGFVSVINMEDMDIVYQKQISGQVHCGIVSLQFEQFLQDGIERKVLLVGTEDSSVLAIEEETGNATSPNFVHTKNPCRALFMHVLDASQEGASLSANQDTSKENSVLLLCSESAVRLYSLSHTIQGIKKQIGKKKLSGNCCYASVIHGTSYEIGLLLVFANGKIDIRSLPDLNLLKEASLRGFKFSKNPSSYSALCGSSDGELIIVNGDQQIFFFSTLSNWDAYRHLEHINALYRKDILLQEESSHVTNSPKEKKMGLFGKVMKDLKGNKTKNNEENSGENTGSSSCEELSNVLETSNFPMEQERRNSSEKDEQDVELNIDDIEIEDNKERNKAQQFAALSKHKLGKGLQALKGKLKPKTDEKVNTGKNKAEEETAASTVDQIKMKYGYSTSNETSAAKMAENKLRDNIKKLEGINVRTAEMSNSAQSFSAMAKELLKSVTNEKSS